MRTFLGGLLIGLAVLSSRAMAADLVVEKVEIGTCYLFPAFNAKAIRYNPFLDPKAAYIGNVILIPGATYTYRYKARTELKIVIYEKGVGKIAEHTLFPVKNLYQPMGGPHLGKVVPTEAEAMAQSERIIRAEHETFLEEHKSEACPE